MTLGLSKPALNSPEVVQPNARAYIFSTLKLKSEKLLVASRLFFRVAEVSVNEKEKAQLITDQLG